MCSHSPAMPRARRVCHSTARKKPMKKIAAGKPFEYSTIHSWPWVPMGGKPVWPGAA